MKTRKLNYRNSKSKRSIRKSSRRNMHKFTKSKRAKITGGGRDEEPIKRKIRMETKVLGKVPAGPKSNIKSATPEEINKYVDNEIKEGPQICTIPAPPYRHAFLVDVQPDKIMISDWGGEAVRDITQRMMTRPDGSQPTYYNETYKTYADFLEKLQEKYDRSIVFYPVDKEMNTCSRAIHKERGGTGGCSDYIYKWAKKYYPDYVV